jgi:hypothetical protein
MQLNCAKKKLFPFKQMGQFLKYYKVWQKKGACKQTWNLLVSLADSLQQQKHCFLQRHFTDALWHISNLHKSWDSPSFAGHLSYFM